MKNIKYYLVIGLSAVFTACTDLLDIEPNNKITPNELFNNPNGAKAFMATIYRDLPIEDYMFMPGTSGEGGFNNPTGNIGLLWYANICEEAVQSQWGEQSPGYVIRADYFNHGYETLRNINLLKSIIPTLDIRDSEKKELEGEAAFMTAYVYFYLAEKFGGVPLIKELQEYDPANPGALVVPRSTEYDTWDYVMQQCDLAAAQLPKERSDRRATRWAALALKSRAALYAASIAKFGELAPMEGEAVTKGLAGMKPENAAYFYQHCIDASLTIMTESNHKLYKPNPASPKEAEENYRSIFVNPNQTDGEAIFIKGIVKEGSEFASSLNYFIEPYQTQGQGKMSPALNLVDAYEDYKDLPGIRSDAKVKTRVNDNYSNAGFDNGYTDYIKVNKDTPYDLFNGIAYGDEKKGLKKIVDLRTAIGDLEDNPGEYFTGSYSSMFMSRNRKKSWSEPSFTIQASGRQAPIHPGGEPMVKVGKDKYIFTDGEENNRRLSVKEIARIQTFPDWYEFSRGTSNRNENAKLDLVYKQIGNAVPVRLALAVAEPIAEFAKKELQGK